MPSENPQIGEMWETSDMHGRQTRGIVADVTEHAIVFVSLTGNRHHVPASRLQSAWRLISHAPSTNVTCARRGCRHGGILRIQRGTTPEWLCPRHLPIGVQATLTWTGPAEEQTPPPRHVIQCPACSNTDPIEDERYVTGRLDHGQSGWWTCTRCNYRWGLIVPPDDDRSWGWIRGAIEELCSEMENHNARLSSIEVGLDVWRGIQEGFTVEFAGQDDILVHGARVSAVSTLDRNLVVLHATGGSHLVPPRVNRIGGSPNRTVSAQALSVEGSGSSIVPTNPTSRRFDLIDRDPREDVDVGEIEGTFWPRTGDRYQNYKQGQIVEILKVREDTKDSSYAITFRVLPIVGEPHAPVTLFASDFHATYKPCAKDQGSMQIDLGLTENERWQSIEHDEFIEIVGFDSALGVVRTRGSSSGKERSFRLFDFTSPKFFRKVTLKSLFQRLRDDG